MFLRMCKKASCRSAAVLPHKHSNHMNFNIIIMNSTARIGKVHKLCPPLPTTTLAMFCVERRTVAIGRRRPPAKDGRRTRIESRRMRSGKEATREAKAGLFVLPLPSSSQAPITRGRVVWRGMVREPRCCCLV